VNIFLNAKLWGSSPQHSKHILKEATTTKYTGEKYLQIKERKERGTTEKTQRKGRIKQTNQAIAGDGVSVPP
jgi:hypothetical protein